MATRAAASGRVTTTLPVRSMTMERATYETKIFSWSHFL